MSSSASSDEASSSTSSEVEKHSATSSPNHSPSVSVVDKWAHSATGEIVVDVLTPPREEDNPNSAQLVPPEVEDKKPAGRLKFFKDGLLCLELLHHDEGKCTKWVQSKAKTFVPPVVRVAKEAKIPCQSMSTLFPIAASIKSSDGDGNGCEVSSTPAREPRNCGWRKSNAPKRGIASERIFYMKPAPCVHLLLRDEISRVSTCLRRQPCKSRPFRAAQQLSTVDENNGNSKSECSCYDSQGKIKPREVNPPARVQTPRKSIVLVLDDLSRKNLLKSEDKARPAAEFSSKPEEARGHGEKSQVFCRSVSSTSKKKSRNLSLHASYLKPILNVPGAFMKFKTKSMDNWPSKSPLPPVNFPLPIPLPMALSMVYGSPDVTHATNGPPVRRNSAENDKMERLRKNLRPSKSRFGTKPSANASNSVSREKVVRRHANTERLSPERSPCAKANEGAIYLDAESQQFLKQQTISTAISYTINSLLGNGQHSPEESHDKYPHKSKNSKISSVDNRLHNGNKEAPRRKGSLSHIAPEDQTLFLRHLLDTSDPIPSTSTAGSSECDEGDTAKRTAVSMGSNSNKEIKQEKTSKRKSPKTSTTVNESRNKLLIMDNHRTPENTSISAYCGPTGRPRKTEDVSAFHQRHNPSPCFSSPFPVFNSTSHPRDFNYDTALNLSRRDPIPNANGIIDLSLSSKNRTSHRASDLAWCGQGGVNSNVDSDVPLNLCKKNTRAS